MRFRPKTGPYSPRPAIRPIGPSIAYLQLTQGYYALIDSDDASECERWNWAAMKDKRDYYVGTHIPKDDGYPVVRLQRFLLNDGRLVDHRNGRTLDNRRYANLRYATKAQNCQNRGVNSTSKTGVKGVTLTKQGTYRSEIRVAGKLIYLGTHKEITAAAMAYSEAARLHYGEFARTSSFTTFAPAM